MKDPFLNVHMQEGLTTFWVTSLCQHAPNVLSCMHKQHMYILRPSSLIINNQKEEGDHDHHSPHHHHLAH